MLRLRGIVEVWARAEWSGWENRWGPSLWFSIPALLPIWSIMLINKWINKYSNYNCFKRHPICNSPGKPVYFRMACQGCPILFFFCNKVSLSPPTLPTYLAVSGLGLWDLVPWPGIKVWPLHWELGVLATGPPGKSPILWFSIFILGNFSPRSPLPCSPKAIPQTSETTGFMH